jgi:pimeloyl-ACP methyl ester carboxylesterase
MPSASVNGIDLYYEVHGTGQPLVLLHGGLMTIDLNWAPLLGPLSAQHQVIAVELQGHGHTPDPDRPMSITTMGDDVVALLDHLGVAEADVFGFSLGGLVAFAMAFDHPGRVRRMVAGSADPFRPPGRESAPLEEGDDRMPTQEDFQAMQDSYAAVAPDPAHFEAFAERTSTMVHTFEGWTADQLRTLTVPTLLIFGDRDFSPLPDVVELHGMLPSAQLAVLPGTTHMGVASRVPELLALLGRFLAD